MEIKDIIKNRRKELNLTYEDIAIIVGVGKSTVRKWETGMIENMKRDKIVLLAKALQVTPTYLMGWEDEKNNTINTENIDYIEKLSKQYNLNEMDKKIIKLYISLTEEQKENVIEYVKKFTNLLPDEDIDLDIEKEVKEYRKALEEEKKGKGKIISFELYKQEKKRIK